VTLPVAVRRQGYRLAFVLLRTYWFVSRPTLRGVKCVITDGQDVLLVRHTYGARAWDLPGGTIKRGEPPIDTARREMREELGLRIEDWAPLGEVWANIHHCRDTLHCFQATLRAPQLELERAELEAAAWFPRDRLPADTKPYVPGILALLDGRS
jgi:8-oxo-dGTP pyrophosphatase MutT (NUDIX family)